MSAASTVESSASLSSGLLTDMLTAAIIATSLVYATGANAFWRVACSGNALVKERADPIISPGEWL